MSGQLGAKLFELLEVPGNGDCADCGRSDPPLRWASSSLGIFLCMDCVGSHRGLGVNHSITKSIELDKWTEPMYEFMASMGNVKSNAIWAKKVPICWRKPTPEDHDLEFYVEEWIRAKYERREFREDNEKELVYCSGEKFGFLHKKERHANKWNPRYFRLSAETHSLCYYKKKEDLNPYRRMDLRNVNVRLCNLTKTDKAFSMQISAPEEQQKKGKTTHRFMRNIYVYADTGREIVEWFLAIRAARFKVLNLGETDVNIDNILSSDYIKEGFLKKSGPKENDTYLQRWIAIEPSKFSYFEHKLDSVPKSEVKLMDSITSYNVSEGVEGKHPEEPHPFMVCTPERVFNFAAETEKEMEEWINAFRKAMEMEPVNNDNANCVRLASVTSVVSHVSQISASSSDSTLSS
eukprot:gene9097-10068_t